MTETLTVVIGANPPSRLDKALSRDVPEAASLSRSRLAKLIESGDVRRGQEVLRNQRAAVSEGDEIEISLPAPTPSHIEPEEIPLNVVFEDDDLIVIDKPAGMVVHPAPGTPSGTLVNALLAHAPNLKGVGGVGRPGIVHRIDKDTSGLLVVAKSDAAHQGLAAQFEAHTAERRYLAICHGMPNSGDPRLRGTKGVSFEPGGVVKITTGLARHKTDRQKQAVLFNGGRHAVTRVRVLEPLGTPAGAALVSCRLETGRTHQIRVHMAHVGHGLIGDPTYGGRRKMSGKVFSDAALDAAKDFPRQALHAETLGFEHPLCKEALKFTSPIPEDMQNLLNLLRKTPD